ncbi:MAG: hypothetical protein R5N60_10415 [Cutibacterium granulosum]|nr:hypothetical protein [Cutibacterium granulosum]
MSPPHDVDLIWNVVGKYYRLIFIDTGNDESDPVWLEAIEHADQIVVPTTTRADHAEAGALLLNALRGRDQHSRQLADNAVAVVTQADPRASKTDITNIVTGYDELAREVVTIPHDPAIVDGILQWDSLRPSTQRAWLRAAAAVDALAREARELGVSKSALVQWLIQNVPRDAQGVPAGWAESHHNNEELPIDTP